MLLKQKNPHGGDTYNKTVELDFSSNINPLGMPPAVVSAIQKKAEDCSAYPDPYCRRLRTKLAAVEKVPEDCILFGNGAAELIYAFAYALPKEKPALLYSPTFSEYETALRAAGVPVEHYFMREEEGFRLTERFLETDFSRYSAVFLCTPNNPTGLTVPARFFEAILLTGVRLFADLCFLDLSDEPGKYDVPALLKRYPNLTVLKAFTKNYAIAGVRLGYVLCSDGDFLQKMSEKSPCWNVSSLAQAAGEAALGCGDWIREAVNLIRTERARLQKALEDFGFRVYPGEADYLFFYSEADLCGPLLDRGILVRDCSNYVGVRKGHIRVAVRTKAENDRLLAAIREVLYEKS